MHRTPAQQIRENLNRANAILEQGSRDHAEMVRRNREILEETIRKIKSFTLH